ncbi:uncharacterized protein TRIADDRAFT_57366 [Trichoplax adhaerens]|uniref:G-protein coupled receptors family 1 profile domain-containing protein n=1 Tax=Trichoplax adhaerens TaxID=10228 RepID=B3RZ88_TRIAD|nr:hypothetical protein TRIADDRAFT_57366 [Trichoplax adhaerens]EDV24160.1 hypothetical protein TRIADDRAFT_57366 [Trichoplax adhaerens]|eukprot:XP_002113686.1 hypothetical protein TRIADDRAFT_57366 [Trichoplax adhaerens]
MASRKTTVSKNGLYQSMTFVFALQIIGYSLIFVFSIFSNVLICIVILRKKIPHNFTNWNIFNLAVADILITLTIPFAAYENFTNKFIFGQFLCKVIYSTRNIAIYMSCLILVFISYNRFRAVTLIKQQQTVYKYTILTTLIAWIIAIIATLPQTIILTVNINGSKNGTRCREDWQNQDLRIAYGFFLLITFFLIPFAAISCCHVLIGWRLWHKTHPLSGRSKIVHQKKKKIVWMLVIVVTAFFICHFPPNVIFLLYELNLITWATDIAILTSITYWLGYSHSLWNPVIYGALNKTMRDAILGTVFEVKKTSANYVRR